MHRRSWPQMAAAWLLVLLVLGTPASPVQPAFAAPHRQSEDDKGDEDPFTNNPIFVEQAERESDLGQYTNDTPSAQVRLALYGRRALAKDAGVPQDGTHLGSRGRGTRSRRSHRPPVDPERASVTLSIGSRWTFRRC